MSKRSLVPNCLRNSCSIHEVNEWRRECRAVILYQIFSDTESGTVRQILYLDLANHAQSQAELWRLEARKVGFVITEYQERLLDKAQVWLVQVFGPRWAGTLLWRIGRSDFEVYARFYHRGIGRFLSGVIDGLITNACVIFGVAGIANERPAMAMAGLLGLLFGAGLAGLGDWLAAERRLERLGKFSVPDDHLRDGEEAGLKHLLVYRGLNENDAAQVVQSLHDDPVHALGPISRAIKGLGPGDHDPPHSAAIVGLSAFSVGALIPLSGLYLGSLYWAAPVAAGVSAAALCGLVVTKASLASFPVLRGAGTLLFGIVVVAATWLLGWWLGRGF